MSLRQLLHRSALPLAMFVALLALPVARGEAQEAPPAPPAELEVLGAEYDHATGEVSLQLRADGGRDLQIENLTVLIDAVPREVVEGLQTEDAPPDVLLAIDVSGSMVGAPIVAASQAGAAFVEKLAEGDRVGLLTFSDTPQLAVPLTADHGQVLGVLPGLVANGETALYDAIRMGLEHLQGSATSPDGTERSALVLLSDGEDTASGTAEADALALAEASGIQVYTFGLGATADLDFLRQLAERSGGTAFEVPDDTSLSAVFSALGGRLGATRELRVRAPGLATEHQVEVRARIDGQPVSASFTLTVPPAQIGIELAPREGVPTDAPFDLALSGVPLDSTLRVTIEGEPSPGVTATGGRVLIDPWRVSPGPVLLNVEATQGDAVVASGARALEIPELAPVVRVEPVEGVERTYRATARLQGAAPPTLVARAGDVEVARVEGSTLEATAPDGATELTFDLVSSEGSTVLTETATLPVAEESSPLVLIVLGALVLLLGGGGWWYLRRRRRAVGAQPEFRRTGRILNQAMQPRQPGDVPTPRTARLVVMSERGEARIVAVGPRPLTVGSGPGCDITLEGPEVRAQHARVSLTSAGTLSVHGLGARGARPYEGDIADQWLTLRPGEAISIGSWSLQLEDHVPREEAS